MKTIIVAILLVGFALARPEGDALQSDPSGVQTLRYENDNSGHDGYKYAFETSDGTSRQEQGQMKNVGEENQAMEVKGSYQYTSPEGKVITVNYVADENGFRTESDHNSNVDSA